MTAIFRIVKGTFPCRHCDRAARLLEDLGLPYTTHTMPTAELKEFLAAFGKETVPQIFLGEGLIGGADALEKYLGDTAIVEQAQAFADLVPDIKVLRLTPRAVLPTYGSEEAAGLDLYADLAPGEGFELQPGQMANIPTGIAVVIPAGHYLRIAPRSGLGNKGLVVLAGVIDRDYRGEIKVIVANSGNRGAISIQPRDRIAQGILEACTRARVVEVDTLTSTARGTGGFGSTGR